MACRPGTGGRSKSAITFFKRFIATWKSVRFSAVPGHVLVFNGYQLGASFTFYNMTYYLFDGDTARASHSPLVRHNQFRSPHSS